MINPHSCKLLWRLVSFILICFFSWGNTSAQNNIRRVEYYLNSDPGIGKAINVPVTSGTEVDVNFEIDVSKLASGFNLMGLRGYNGKGWSQTYTRMIVIPHTGNVISKLEYFWDNDPGVGQATNYAYTADGEAVVDIDILCQGLSSGMHTLGIRALSGEVWSQTYLHSIAVVATGNYIDGVEYFWDNDPGVGNATPYSCNAEGDIIVSFDALCEDLPFGIHVLGIRASSRGKWSHTYLHSVAVAPPDIPIEYIEYFWDDDPGKGQGTSLAFAQMDGYAEVKTENIPTTDLSVGPHTLFIRARAGGLWSHHYIKSFFVNGTIDFDLPKDTVCINEEFTVSNLSKEVAEGTTFQWDMNNDGTIESNSNTEFRYKYTKAGRYEICMIAKLGDEEGLKCIKEIEVLPMADPAVTIKVENSEFCTGDAVVFEAIVENGGNTPLYEWFKNGTSLGAGEKTYTLDDPADGDIIKVIVTSAYPCCNNPEVVSEEVTLKEVALIQASLAHYFPVYTNESSFVLTGGLPEGGLYYINGVETTTLDPSQYTPGTYQVTYKVKNSNGCTGEASRSFPILTAGEGSLKKGDVNKDESIDVYDALCIVDIVYDIIYPTYSLVTADVNEDNKIDVSDIIGVAGIILDTNGGSSKTRSAGYSSLNTRNTLSADKVTAAPGSKVKATIALNCEAWVSGAQFNITLPEGVIPVSGSKDIIVGRTPNTAGNTYTVLTYSLSLERLSLQLPLELIIPENIAEGEYPIEITGGVLSDYQMENVLTRANDGILHINRSGIDNDGSDGIRVISGEKEICIIGAQGSRAMVYDLSGKTLHTLTITEERECVPVNTGIYLVKIVNDQRTGEYKVIIK